MNGFQKKIVLRALDELEQLSEWEGEFINSLADRDDDYVVSEKQNKILNRIQQKLDFGG